MKRRVLMERIPAPLTSLYEKASRLVIESYYSELAEEIVSNLATGAILDLGTGPGYLPVEIVRRSSSIRCDAIDLSPGMIKTAQTNALRAGVADRLNFEVGNAAQLRFEDESYDMVISTGMLHMLRDPVKVLRECCRVLKPGGDAWILDPARVSSQMDVKEWKASLNFLERLSYVLFKLYLRMNPTHTYSRDQVEQLIAATSFEDYRVDQEGEEIRVRLKKSLAK